MTHIRYSAAACQTDMPNPLMAVAVGPGPSFGAPTELFQTRVAGGVTSQRTHYVPSRDGRRFLVNTPTGDAAVVPITVVLNWPAALKK